MTAHNTINTIVRRMVSLVSDHNSAHQAPYDKPFLSMSMCPMSKFSMTSPFALLHVRFLRRITPFEIT
jgi:hypothetical protein